MKNNKKKGFTLIELIAVIAILAILGAILVPNVLGYRKKAEASNIRTSAKTIFSAIQAYDSDKDDTLITDENDKAQYKNALKTLVDNELVKKDEVPECLGGSGKYGSDTITYAQLKLITDGSFTVNSVKGLQSTITF